jgi:phosphohistidine phosphatase SixA
MQGYADCANQRPLSAQGRDDAARLGGAILALRLPLGDTAEILVSPMCRTMDHATLMFGRARHTGLSWHA